MNEEKEQHFSAARLRSPQPPPVPPKPRLSTDNRTPAAPSTSAATSSMSAFTPLTALPTTVQPSHFPDSFTVWLHLILLRPRHHSQLDNHTDPLAPLAEQHTAAFFSPAHTRQQMVQQLLDAATTLFGLDVSERQRWHWRWHAACPGTDGSSTDVQVMDHGVLVEMCRARGDWGWRMELVETERNAWGGWGSVGVPWLMGGGVRDEVGGGYVMPEEAVAGTGKEV